MKKKQTKTRKPREPKPIKARPAAAAAPPPEAPEPFGADDNTLSIEAMLRAQLVETHLAAMDCLRRARTAATPEVRHQTLSHATKLLSLFTRQVNAIERGRWPVPSLARGAQPAGKPVTPQVAPEIVAPDIAAAIHEAVEARRDEIMPPDDPAGIASPAPGEGQIPARQDGTAASGP